MVSRKLSYQFELAYIKYSPFIISILIVFYHTMKFLTLVDMEWLEYLCFPSMLTALHMYNSRETFMLCKVHRCFVNYVVANVIACLAEHYWIDPYMNAYWYAICMLGTVTALTLGLVYYTENLKLRNINK